MTDELRKKVVVKASKLKAQMESEAKLGNEEAAQAFAAAMQRLMLEHELSDAELEAARRAGERPVEEPVVEAWVDLKKLGLTYKHVRSATLETLAQVVARAHLCKILVKNRSNEVCFVGTRRHAEVAEYMLATLHRALHKIAKDSYERFHHATVPPTPAPGYVSTFKVAFLQRLDARYVEERRRVEADHRAAAAAEGSNPTQALMRLDHAVARVDRYISDRYRTSIRPAQKTTRQWHAAADEAGRRAADAVRLKADGLKAGDPKSTKQLKGGE